MRSLSLFSVVIFSLLLSAPARAQQVAIPDITKLQDQLLETNEKLLQIEAEIKLMQEISLRAKEGGAVRTVNDRNLEQRKKERSKLSGVLQLQAEMADLRQYRDKLELAEVLTAKDKEEINLKYAELKRDYDKILNPTPSPVAATEQDTTPRAAFASTQTAPTTRSDDRNEATSGLLPSVDELLAEQIAERAERGIVASGELSRAIVGFEQAGASSVSKEQRYFFNMHISVPFPWQSGAMDRFKCRRLFKDNPEELQKCELSTLTESRDDYIFGPKWRIWGDARVTSVPKQISEPVAAFAENFGDRVTQLKVNELAQAVEFQTGIEYRIGAPRKLFPSFDLKTKQRFTLNFIASAGAITPTAGDDAVPIFKIPNRGTEQHRLLTNRFPSLENASEQFLAFVSPDRDRFFRQFQAGFRFKTYYFSQRGNRIPRAPGMLDVTYGVNEAVTGGGIRGGVLRFDGFYPLPFDKLSFIYLYGTALMKPVKSKINGDPLILEPVNPELGLRAFSQNVRPIVVPQIDRDYYRIGFGIDFVNILSKITPPNKQ
jgi:hypothetical protein